MTSTPSKCGKTKITKMTGPAGMEAQLGCPICKTTAKGRT